MLVTIGVIAFIYYGVILPLGAVLSGIIEGKIESDIKFGPQRARNAAKLDELERKLEYQDSLAQQYLQGQNSTMYKKRSKKVRPLQGIFANNMQNKPYRNPVKGRIMQRKNQKK